MSVSDTRPRTARLGERLAREHLARRGYRIVAHNHRTRFGEIDVIATDRDTLVFCEVKTRRAGSGNPFDSLHEAKRQQVRRMARAWLADPDAPVRRSRVRFDAIGVVVDAAGGLVALDHLEGAF